MPLQDYSTSWTEAQFESDLAKVAAQVGGDTIQIPGLLNNKGWTLNDFKLRDYVQLNHPALYMAWQDKYGSFFKTKPIILIGIGLFIFGCVMVFRARSK